MQPAHRYWDHSALFDDPAVINFKAAVNTKRTTKKLDVRGLSQFLFSVSVAQVGAGGAGAFKLTLDGYAGKEGATRVIEPIDIATAIASEIGTGVTRVATVGFGTGFATFGKNGGTITADLQGVLRALSHITLTLEVTTQATAATSNGGTVSLSAS